MSSSQIGLSSLEGSGTGNQFVQLVNLNEVRDFSPVRESRKVVIWGCRHLIDASCFVGTNYLVFGECGSLNDGRMLCGVRHLELIGCNGVKTIEGLEESEKELIVRDCLLLRNHNNTKQRGWDKPRDEWEGFWEDE